MEHLIGEIAQWLRAVVALPEDQVWFPVPIWQLPTTCNSNLGTFNALFWPQRALDAGDAETKHPCTRNKNKT